MRNPASRWLAKAALGRLDTLLWNFVYPFTPPPDYYCIFEDIAATLSTEK